MCGRRSAKYFEAVDWRWILYSDRGVIRIIFTMFTFAYYEHDPLKINTASCLHRSYEFTSDALARQSLTIMHQRFLWIFEISAAATATVLQPTHATSWYGVYEISPSHFLFPTALLYSEAERIIIQCRPAWQRSRPSILGCPDSHRKYRRTPSWRGCHNEKVCLIIYDSIGRTRSSLLDLQPPLSGKMKFYTRFARTQVCDW